MILDSSFLMDLMDEDAGVVAKMEPLDRDQLTVPTIVYTEFETGLDAGSSQAEAFEAMVADVTLAPYDAEAPRHAVSIQRHLSEQGRPIGAVDAMITGTALARDEAILTRNVAEFNRALAHVSPY
jgi:predicted nucleic acid-binding protein